jgi:hypothetical protein
MMPSDGSLYVKQPAGLTDDDLPLSSIEARVIASILDAAPADGAGVDEDIDAIIDPLEALERLYDEDP